MLLRCALRNQRVPSSRLLLLTLRRLGDATSCLTAYNERRSFREKLRRFRQLLRAVNLSYRERLPAAAAVTAVAAAKLATRVLT